MTQRALTLWLKLLKKLDKTDTRPRTLVVHGRGVMFRDGFYAN